MVDLPSNILLLMMEQISRTMCCSFLHQTGLGTHSCRRLMVIRLEGGWGGMVGCRLFMEGLRGSPYHTDDIDSADVVLADDHCYMMWCACTCQRSILFLHHVVRCIQGRFMLHDVVPCIVVILMLPCIKGRLILYDVVLYFNKD